MIRDVKCPILAKPTGGTGVYQHITPKDTGWNLLHFAAQRMGKGEIWRSGTAEFEYVVVLLGGEFTIATPIGRWRTEGGRRDVFSGLPHAVYLPPQTEFTLTAESDSLDIAYGWCRADKSFTPRFITPEDVHAMGIEFRGGDNASRQINSILPPGSPCQRLVCVEVYTPSGNWSSFPAHKHDTRRIDPQTGKVLEADLEEVYFYKMSKPQGFALQKVYTDDRSLDEIAEAHPDDVVLVPRGYHPVVAGHGYDVYYLNVLAGSDQCLSNTDDPDHRWIYGTWRGMDPRLPIVGLQKRNQGKGNDIA